VGVIKKEFNNYGSGKESAASRFRHVGLAVFLSAVDINMPGGSDFAKFMAIHNNTTAARRNLKASGASAFEDTEGFMETFIPS
jgi:hypothetical protein